MSLESLTPEVLRELLRYDPKTGILYWRRRALRWFPHVQEMRRWNTRYAGSEALGAKTDEGYKTGRVLKRRVSAHRVAFAMHYGRWPDREIDHQNHDRADNRIENLREASTLENGRNKLRRGGTSRYQGVALHKASGRWVAYVEHNRRRRHLGTFDSEEAAARARDSAARRAYGEFGRLNFDAASV